MSNESFPEPLQPEEAHIDPVQPDTNQPAERQVPIDSQKFEFEPHDHQEDTIEYDEDEGEYDDEEDVKVKDLPDGFKFLTSVSEDDDFGVYEIDDLQEFVKIEQLNGFSCALDRATQGSPKGKITFRVIHDHKCRMYIYRKDVDNTTHLKVSSSYQTE